ncbi:origin recognition complex subunit 3 N-terminus-domain-containing protein [Mycena leptocephala]|nr:origin recognition complex subunit 3 N-terminus-domain-containing protein [Mycena leptocephala]
MSMDLEDIQQTVIYIPDLEDGPQLRFDAYKDAWTRCLDRMKLIIAELYSPVVSGVMERLNNIHTDVLPGLPFPELPVITVADVSGSSGFLDHLSGRFDGDALCDALNLTSGMKNLIGATSLAPYDLGLLQAWYNATKDPRPSLIVLLHEFEQFDSNVVQDMFYICSLQVSRLPLTFILSLSTPSPSSYLQASLSRSTLTLIRPYHFAVPSGREVLQNILLKTFFDPTFDLLLLPGPTLLEFIEDYYTTHSPSLDVLITILQVAHLKHYTTDLFTLLSSATPPISPNPTSSELSFLEALLARLHAPGTTSSPKKKGAGDWRAHARSPDILLQAVDTEREAFARCARKTKLGLTLLNLVLASLRGTALDKVLDRWKGAAGMWRVLDTEEGGVAGLAALLRKLPTIARDELLENLEGYLEGLPQTIRPADSHKIPDLRSASSADVADWVETLLSDLLQPLESSTPLWSVWYTGLTPFPSEMLNPALRPSIISGLSFPHSYAGQDLSPEDEEILEDLPDTSILFKGYAKAGKMINVYDWFDHFRTVLEGQRTRAAAGKGKGKGKGKKADKGDGEEEERWKLSVQARFIRALHELDYLGFIKHTSRGGGGRKGEYVLKTVLGILE